MQITGAGLGNIATHSSITSFADAIPLQATGAEAMFLMAMLQHRIDSADGINHVHRIHETANASQDRGIAVQYGMGDTVVFNNSSLAFAELAGLPHIAANGTPVDFLDESDDFVEGTGILQSPPGLDFDLGRGSSLRINIDGHGTAIVNKPAFTGYLRWLDTAILGK